MLFAQQAYVIVKAQGRGHIYIRQIPTGHGISNIYHLGVLTKNYIGLFGSLYKRPSSFDCGI